CCAGSRAEYGIHENIGKEFAPPGGLSRSGVCAPAGAGRNGRRAALIQPARHAAKVTATRLSFFALRPLVGAHKRPESGVNSDCYLTMERLTSTFMTLPLSGSVAMVDSMTCPSRSFIS